MSHGIQWDILEDLPEELAGSRRDKHTTELADVTCLRESTAALLVEIKGTGIKRWVPKSQLKPGNQVERPGDTGTLCISPWLARKWAEENPVESAISAAVEEQGVEVPGVVCLKESEKAILVELADGKEVWIPRSHIRKGSEVEFDGDAGVLRISPWLAKQKGLGGP